MTLSTQQAKQMSKAICKALYEQIGFLSSDGEEIVFTTIANELGMNPKSQTPTGGLCPEQCPKYPFCACMVEG